MTRAEAELLAKTMLLDAWLRGHIHDRSEFERLFHSLDPKPRRPWVDSWLGVTVAAILLGAIVGMCWAWLG